MRRWICLFVVGVALFSLTTGFAADLGKTTVPLDGRNSKTEETNLGNFVADAIRVAGNADVAIIHAHAFRANALIDKGVITDQAIRNSLSSPTSAIVKFKLTPAQLRAVMQHALSTYPKPGPWFLQFSGMQVTFDSTQPEAMRVTRIVVGNKPLDFSDNKTLLTVATSRELALGAVGYLQVFLNDAIAKSMEFTEVTLLDAVTKDLLRQGGEITPKVEQRLQDTAAKQERKG